MSHTIETDTAFKRSLILAIDPTFEENDLAIVDGTFEAIVLQLLQHYQSDRATPEFQEISIPEIGDTVTWNYGKGQAVGKVKNLYTKPVTLKLQGSTITRNGTPENPAILILQDDRRILKLASELKITEEIDYTEDVAIAYSFDFDGRYDHIDLTPTKGMIKAAKQAIAYIEDGKAGDGMGDETIRWVRKVAKGEPLSLEKAKKGYKFFKRHNFYKKTGDRFDPNTNSPAPWYVARMAWFGDDGEKFFNRVWRQIQAVDADPEYSEQVLDFGCIIHKVIPWQGIDIGCEYRPGDVRFKGTKHARKMRSGYGHARNHIGADGESLDVYLSPDFFTVNGQPSDRIFEVRQMSLEDGDFDEHKYMVGYQDMQEAKAAYLTEMPERAFGGIREITVEMLRPYHKSVRSFSEVESTLDFNENGLKVKAILDAAYADGITGLENVKVEGDRISGIFLDSISPGVVKRFKFTITPDSTTFELLDPTQDFSEYLEFAKPQAPKVGAKTQSDRLGRIKTCNPEKSFPCGKTCRPNGGKCNFTNSPESKQMVQDVIEDAPKSKSKQKGERSQLDETKSTIEALTTASDRADYAKYLKSNQRSETLTRAKRNLKKIPNPPPYLEEVAALEMYSSVFYGKINSFLRGEQSDIDPVKKREIESHIKMASSALEAMPKYDGVTYRGAVLPREVVDQYKQGKTIQEKAFVSTTVNQKIAEDFASVDDLEDGYTPVVYEIKSKKGVSIKDFSIVPKEDEILFTPNSKFKVSKVEMVDGKAKISMEEV